MHEDNYLAFATFVRFAPVVVVVETE